MSLEARKRAWVSTQAGTDLLLLLAIAEHARGYFAWPSVPTLAALIKKDVDYTHKLIKKLVRDGDILHKRGGGRGNCSIYCVVTNCDPDERSALAVELARSRIVANQRVIVENTVLDSSVLGSGGEQSRAVGETPDTPENTVLDSSVLPPENTVLENTVIENTVLQSEKHCNTVMSEDRAFDASESAKPLQKSTEKDHDLHDDDDDARAREKRAGKGRQQRPPTHVAYLSRKGMGAAHLFAHLDSAAAIADFDARIADGWDIPAIVSAWRIAPPAEGSIYERRANTQENLQQRSADRPAAQQRSIIDRPGYYTKRKPSS